MGLAFSRRLKLLLPSLVVLLLAQGATARVAEEPKMSAQAELRPDVRQRIGFGHAVALSDDGTTAAVGTLYDKPRGSVYVFKGVGRSWRPDGRLIPPAQKTKVKWGLTVALSGDGRVVLIGLPNDADENGSAWIYTARGGGVWVGRKLKPSGLGDASNFGTDVDLSRDGSSAIVGAEWADGGKGAAWVFVRAGSSWKQQAKLTGSNEKGKAHFGASVALNASGQIALVGGEQDNDKAGAVWPFVRVGTAWKSHGKLASPLKGRRFGHDVAISGSGSRAIVSEWSLDSKNTTVWTLTRSGSKWQGKRDEFATSTRIDGFGHSIALSADGSTAAVWGQGVLIFTRADGSWSLRQALGLGLAFDLAADGRTLLGDAREVDPERVWVFSIAPSVSSISPSAGPTEGGTKAVITGANFAKVIRVMFGPNRAPSYTVDSPTQITAVSPPEQAGAVDVTIVESNAESSTSTGDRFLYLERPAVTGVTPTAGPTTGGTTVTITGRNFTNVIAVEFGPSNATSFKVDSPTQITAVSPPAQAGVVDVTVTTPGGTSATSAADGFTYQQLLATTLITFDDLTAPGPGGAGLAVTTQYASQGVTFSNASAFDYSKGSSAIAGFAHSGSVAVEPCFGIEFCTAPFVATFSTPQQTVRLFVGASFQLQQPETVQLQAFDASSQVVGTATATLEPTGSTVPIRAQLETSTAPAQIVRVQVSVPDGFNNGLAFDDVIFVRP